MKKYYVEISAALDFDLGVLNIYQYVLQSEWFDTKNEALKWAKNITFITKALSMSLMSANFDNNGGSYGDITFEGILEV